MNQIKFQNLWKIVLVLCLLLPKLSFAEDSIYPYKLVQVNTSLGRLDPNKSYFYLVGAPERIYYNQVYGPGAPWRAERIDGKFQIIKRDAITAKQRVPLQAPREYLKGKGLRSVGGAMVVGAIGAMTLNSQVEAKPTVMNKSNVRLLDDSTQPDAKTTETRKDSLSGPSWAKPVDSNSGSAR